MADESLTSYVILPKNAWLEQFMLPLLLTASTSSISPGFPHCIISAINEPNTSKDAAHSNPHERPYQSKYCRCNSTYPYNHRFSATTTCLRVNHRAVHYNHISSRKTRRRRLPSSHRRSLLPSPAQPANSDAHNRPTLP